MLNDWLKSIIIIILIAAFVDLILPNRSMQRYVKVVVSLFVLLTILTPIVKIIVADFDWEKFEFPDNPLDSIVASAVPLEQVEREAEMIRGKTEQQALDIVAGQVEQLIHEQMESIASHVPLSVQVELLVTEDGEPQIEQVTIELIVAGYEQHILAAVEGRASPENARTDGSSSDVGGAGGSGGESPGAGTGDARTDEADHTKRVEPVEPIRVDSVAAIELSERSERNEPTTDRSTTGQERRPSDTAQAPLLGDAIRQLERTIREALQHEWGLTQEQIQFRY